ncbi:MAG: leucyl aminopeptidase [Candidatus Babeliaceae bacterium]
MITFKISEKPVQEQQVQGYVVLCEQDFSYEHTIKKLSVFYNPLKELIAQREFKGHAGSSLVVAGSENGRLAYCILVGIGLSKKSAPERLENYRRALGSVIRIAEQIKITQLALDWVSVAGLEIDDFRLAHETVSTLAMASYHFDQYITDVDRKMSRDYTVIIAAPQETHDQIKVGIEWGQHIGYAVNQARQWCDLPPCVLTPNRLGEEAKRIAQAHNLKVTVFNEQQIIEMGMGGLEAVAKGSEQECRFVIMEYKANENAPTIGLVGKGITFDSGGLSIKPAVGMETMKDDMAGAAAVISTMEALAHLKPKINVIAFAPLTENLISGHATKPGDIVQFYNGKTAEIKNTDAEGRLILADALSYAIKNYQLDAVFTIATLTGSCAYALGPFFAGLMSQHEEVADKVIQAAQQTGDRVWPLPFNDDYKKAVRSDVADLCNIGKETYRAGAITAGFFLQAFVGDKPWVHLDVAGTSFNVPDISYYRPGATGFGVRLFIDMIMNWKQK